MATGYTYFIPQEEHLESSVVTRGYLEGRMVVGMAGRYPHLFLALSPLLPALCHKEQQPAVCQSVGFRWDNIRIWVCCQLQIDLYG